VTKLKIVNGHGYWSSMQEVHTISIVSGYACGFWHWPWP